MDEKNTPQRSSEEDQKKTSGKQEPQSTGTDSPQTDEKQEAARKEAAGELDRELSSNDTGIEKIAQEAQTDVSGKSVQEAKEETTAAEEGPAEEEKTKEQLRSIVTPYKQPEEEEKEETPTEEQQSDVESSEKKPEVEEKPLPQKKEMGTPKEETSPEDESRTDLTMADPKKDVVEQLPAEPRTPPASGGGIPTVRTFHADAASAQGQKHESTFSPTRPKAQKEEEKSSPETKVEETPEEEVIRDDSVIPPDHLTNIDALREGRDFEGEGVGKDMEGMVTAQKKEKELEEIKQKPQNEILPQSEKAPEAPSSVLDKKPKKSIVRTYEDDSAKTLEEKDGSVVSIAMAERKRQEEDGVEEAPGRPLWQKSIIISALVLMVVGGIGIFGYIAYQRLGGEETVAPTYTPLILAEGREEVNVTGMSPQELRSVLQSFSEESGDQSAIRELLLYTQVQTNEEEGLQEEPLTADQLFESLNLSRRASLVRFLGDRFMIGSFSHENIGTFWLFSTDEFENAFANMLAWEQSMQSDIGFFFSTEEAEVLPQTIPVDETATSTATSSVATAPNTAPRFEFVDLIIQNRDVRALQDQEGRIHLLWAFPIRSALIIASDVQTFEEVLKRVERRSFSR